MSEKAGELRQIDVPVCLCSTVVDIGVFDASREESQSAVFVIRVDVCILVWERKDIYFSFGIVSFFCGVVWRFQQK